MTAAIIAAIVKVLLVPADEGADEDGEELKLLDTRETIVLVLPAEDVAKVELVGFDVSEL